jgi:hypothetical protein
VGQKTLLLTTTTPTWLRCTPVRCSRSLNGTAGRKQRLYQHHQHHQHLLNALQEQCTQVRCSGPWGAQKVERQGSTSIIKGLNFIKAFESLGLVKWQQQLVQLMLQKDSACMQT